MINIQETLADGTLLYGWKFEPPLTPVAPDYAYYFTDKKIFSEAQCEEWNNYLLKQEPILLDKFRSAPAGDGHTGVGLTNITSRYPHFNLLKFDFHLIEHLKTEMLKCIKTILTISDDTSWQETLYANCWFNVLRQGEDMKVHSHGCNEHAFYGFHLTINATETFTSYYHPMYGFQGAAYHTPNKIGYLTLFPNFIPHSVSKNRYVTPRITLAGDIFPSTWASLPHPANNTKNLVEIGTTDMNPSGLTSDLVGFDT